jgi:hypothetical protein
MCLRLWVATVLAAALLQTCAVPAEAASPRQRTRVFASLPDWTGIWESEAWANVTVAGRPVGGIEAVRAKSVLSAHPPYSAEWEARYQEALQDKAAVRAAAMTSKFCEFGFPGALESPAPFQMLVTPEETLFVFATREVRHIYTDGRGHPPEEDIWPTLMGDTIGRWEGHELVTETIARRASAPLRFGSPLVKLSEHARYTERIRMAGPDRLEIELTVEDPVALERPWSMKLSYRRVKNLDRMIHHDCSENDRNPIVDGQLTIAPPRPASATPD